MYGFGVALPPIAAAFADRPHALLLSQLIGGVVALAFAVGSAPVGRLIDRFGYRSVLLVSIVAFSFAGAAGGLMSNLYAILVTRVLLGFTVAGVLVSAFAGIGDLSARDRVRMYGFQGFVGGVLAICTFPAVGWAASLGWRVLGAAVSGSALHTVLLRSCTATKSLDSLGANCALERAWPEKRR